MNEVQSLSRREFFGAAGVGLSAGAAAQAPAGNERRALIAITLDLEMSRNFPTWDQTHWDYEKGNLNSETKRYTVEACRRVRKHGGVVHCFVVGRVLEQADVDWLQEIVKAGHPVGNHTYDHVNVKARSAEDIQFRFRRCPWLIEGQKPSEVIRSNIRMTSAALQTRIGVGSSGFRTPGGFANGLADRPDVQQMLRDLGFSWVSSQYPSHAMSKPGAEPTKEVYDSIVKAQAAAQPFAYGSGLVEKPRQRHRRFSHGPLESEVLSPRRASGGRMGD